MTLHLNSFKSSLSEMSLFPEHPGTWSEYMGAVVSLLCSSDLLTSCLVPVSAAGIKRHTHCPGRTWLLRCVVLTLDQPSGSPGRRTDTQVVLTQPIQGVTGDLSLLTSSQVTLMLLVWERPHLRTTAWACTGLGGWGEASSRVKFLPSCMALGGQ